MGGEVVQNGTKYSDIINEQPLICVTGYFRSSANQVNVVSHLFTHQGVRKMYMTLT